MWSWIRHCCPSSSCIHFPFTLLPKPPFQFSGLIVLKMQQHHNTSLLLQTKQPCLSVWSVYIRNQSGEKQSVEVKSPHNGRDCPPLIRQSNWRTRLISKWERNGPNPQSRCQLIHTGETPRVFQEFISCTSQIRPLRWVGEGISGGRLPAQPTVLRS